MTCKRGVTLIEVVVSIALSAIILTALTCQFVAMVNFNKELVKRIDLIREVRIGMHHMTRNIRLSNHCVYSDPPLDPCTELYVYNDTTGLYVVYEDAPNQGMSYWQPLDGPEQKIESTADYLYAEPMNLGPMESSWLSTPESPNWDPLFDLNNDGIIDLSDLGILAAEGGLNDFVMLKVRFSKDNEIIPIRTTVLPLRQ